MNLSSDWIVVDSTDAESQGDDNSKMHTEPQDTQIIGEQTEQLSNTTSSDLAIDTSSVGILISVLDISPLDAAARLYPDIFRKAHRQLRSLVIKRITKELELASHPEAFKHFNLHAIDGSLEFLLGTIEGPPGSPYAGGLFHILIATRDYPLKAPLFRFLTPIYHPNVDIDGNICLDVLQEMWSPSVLLVMALRMISSILDTPLLIDPLVPDIAKLYERDRELWAENAREWTENFAMDVELSEYTVDRCLELCEEVILKETAE